MLSVCMIVKNEEKMLERTLPTLARGTDELIILDTGSTDNTIEVAKSFGAKVFNFKWIKDFSAARNESLKYAKGDWILWADADEYIKEEDLAALKEILRESKEDAYNIPIYESRLGECDKNLFYFRVKLFRNHKGFRFERPINEQLVDKTGKIVSGGLLTTVAIYHWGKRLDEERMKEKRIRNIEMLKEALRTNKEDPFYRYLLANNLKDSGEIDLAIAEYDAVIDRSKGSLRRASLIKKSWCLLKSRKVYDAFKIVEAVVASDSTNPEAFNLLATIYITIGEIEAAIKVLHNARKLEIGKTEDIYFDLSQYKYMPNYLLGKAYLAKGEKDEALRCFEEAYKFFPDDFLKQEIERVK